MSARNDTSIGLFNFAHSYAVSAVALEKLEVNATHWNAPVYYLYFHAIELYLKSFLAAQSHDLEDMRKEYGHNVRKLAEEAKRQGLDLSDENEEAITLMDLTDNVISSRYIRLGRHTRLPFSVFDGLCRSLHVQVGPAAYQDSFATRRPDAWW